MRLSASYLLEGKVVSVERGETTASVKLELSPGNVLAASLPNEQLERMNLRPGMTARARMHARSIVVGRR
jgi:molybdopterin-binding protein